MCCQKFVKMGCIASKEIDETCPNVFKVINVDDYGNQVGSGLLEIKNFELVLYQKGKNPIMWPLKTLRRYGFDADHFSFESGRRCLTGPGIFAFRCQRAEQLFNLLQSRIQVRELSGHVNIENSMNMRNSSNSDPPSRPEVLNRFNSQLETGRLGSTGTLGPSSPTSTTSEPLYETVVPFINLPDVPENSPPTQLYENNEIITAALNQNTEENEYEEQRQPFTVLGEHSYANASLTPFAPIKAEKRKKSNKDIQIVLTNDYATPYDSTPSPPVEADNSRLYVNMLQKKKPTIQDVVVPEPVPEPEDIKKSKHPIDLFDPQNADEFVGGSLHQISKEPSLPTSRRVVKSLNYIVLDLEQTGDPPKSPTSPNPSESGKRLSEGYTAIDFQKTVALSHSIHPDSSMDRDSCRKTRHSSNAFPHERHGSSVSD